MQSLRQVDAWSDSSSGSCTYASRQYSMMSVSRMAKPAADRRSADLPCQSSNPDVMQGCAACSLMTDQLSGGTTRRAASPSKLSHHLKPIRNRLPGSVGMLLDDGILVLSEQLRHALGHASMPALTVLSCIHLCLQCSCHRLLILMLLAVDSLLSRLHM